MTLVVILCDLRVPSVPGSLTFAVFRAPCSVLCARQVVTFRVEHNQQPSVFVVYNMKNSRVLAVYENISQQLLYLYENFCDNFRNARLSVDSRYTCSPSNNIYARWEAMVSEAARRQTRRESQPELLNVREMLGDCLLSSKFIFSFVRSTQLSK